MDHFTYEHGSLHCERTDADAIADDVSYQYAGCKISKLALSQEMEKPLMMTLDIIGKELTTKAKASHTTGRFFFAPGERTRSSERGP
jgi:hypothetical protein